jgi:LPXTG-motif cell wall-anchored protein
MIALVAVAQWAEIAGLAAAVTASAILYLFRRRRRAL